MTPVPHYSSLVSRIPDLFNAREKRGGDWYLTTHVWHFRSKDVQGFLLFLLKRYCNDKFKTSFTSQQQTKKCLDNYHCTTHTLPVYSHGDTHAHIHMHTGKHTNTQWTQSISTNTVILSEKSMFRDIHQGRELEWGGLLWYHRGLYTYKTENRYCM